MRKLFFALLLLSTLLAPRTARAACTGTDTYSVMICFAGPAHYWRMNALSGTTETDKFNGVCCSSADGSYINSGGSITLGVTALVPLPQSPDSAVQFTQPGSGGAGTSTFMITGCGADCLMRPVSGCSGGCNGNWTYEFWFKQASVGTLQRIFSGADGVTHNYRFSTGTGGALSLAYAPGGSGAWTITSSTTISAATIYYVSVQIQASSPSTTFNQADMYINTVNVVSAPQTSAGGTFNDVGRLYVASEGLDRLPAESFSGVVDEFAVYWKLLSGQERQDHYQGFPTNTLGPRRVIESKWRENRWRPSYVFERPRPIALDEFPGVINALNEKLITAPSQYPVNWSELN